MAVDQSLTITQWRCEEALRAQSGAQNADDQVDERHAGSTMDSDCLNGPELRYCVLLPYNICPTRWAKVCA